MADEDLSHSVKRMLTEDGLVPTQLEQAQETQDQEPEDDLAFPFSRVKKLMQLATSATVKQDSVRLIAKATVRVT
jgi:hypothetical protein